MDFRKLIIAVILYLPIISLAQDKVIDQIVAVVGSNIILKSDVEGMYMQNQAQGYTSDGDMKCEILETLLVDKLLLAEAELDTLIEATPSQINQQMETMLQQYIAHFGSEKAVEDYWKKPITTIRSEMRETSRTQILTQQMQQKIIENVTVTPSEVRAYYRSLAEDEKPVIPTQYEYKQITFTPPIELAEENRVKAQLRELKSKIEEGAPFGSYAILHSEGPYAANGGELPYMGRAEFDEAYASVAFNLKGDRISNVVKTDMGYHIIQLIDRKGEKIKTRNIVLKPKVSPEAKETTSQQLDSLAKIIRKNEIPFEEAASMFSSDRKSRNNGGLVINPNSMSSKFAVEELNADVSRIITGMRVNEVSDPFETVDENERTVYKIIKLVNKTEGHTANLQDDYQQISRLFLAQKRERTLENWIAKQQSKTYIRIDDTYANCNFDFENWIK